MNRTSKLNTVENCLTRVVLLFLFQLKLAFNSFHWSALFFNVFEIIQWKEKRKKKYLKSSHVFKNKTYFKSHFIRFRNTNCEILKEKNSCTSAQQKASESNGVTTSI